MLRALQLLCNFPLYCTKHHRNTSFFSGQEPAFQPRSPELLAHNSRDLSTFSTKLELPISEAMASMAKNRLFVLLFSVWSLLVATTTAIDIQCTFIRDPKQVNITFNPDSITALSGAIRDNTLLPALDPDGVTLSRAQAKQIGWDAAGDGNKYQICLQNNYLFQSTTVPLKDISDAVAQFASTCCPPGQKCQDGRTILKGSGGLNVRVLSQQYGAECCGMFLC